MNRGAVIAAGAIVALSLGAAGAWVRWHAITLPPMPQKEMVPIENRPIERDQDSCEAYLKEPPEQPRMPIQVEWMAPPESWRETVVEVDAVLVGRRSPEPPQEIAPKGSPCTWFTLHAFSVVDAIKGTLPGQRVQVAWMGRRNQGVEGFTSPEAGDLYLLFLKRHLSQSYYHPWYGPYANVRIADGRIIALFDGKPLRRLHGRSAEEFMAQVRGYVGPE